MARFRDLGSVLVALWVCSGPSSLPATPGSAAAGSELAAVPLPGAPPGGLFLDYLAVDRARHRVWVPAGATGRVDVIDTDTRELRAIDGFPTVQAGSGRRSGPSSATLGDGVVYVGNRADSSVCAIDAASLARGGCATIPASPDGVAYVAATREVWVTTPRDDAIVVLDVSAPAAPELAGRIAVGGAPEGYAVDAAHGVFYTSLEDADRTLRIDLRTRRATATWTPACGEQGPRGLALEPGGRFLMVACPDRVEVMDTGAGGRIVSRLDAGAGIDNPDYLEATRSLYVAAGGAGTLTIARLGEDGALSRVSVRPTAPGARNVVAAEDGTAFVADGRGGRILVVRAGGR